jgi:ribose transport system permease protein
MGAQTYVQDLFYGGGLVIAVVLSKIVRDRTEKSQIVQQT